jgi:hypothetical protein
MGLTLVRRRRVPLSKATMSAEASLPRPNTAIAFCPMPPTTCPDILQEQEFGCSRAHFLHLLILVIVHQHSTDSRQRRIEVVGHSQAAMQQVKQGSTQDKAQALIRTTASLRIPRNGRSGGMCEVIRQARREHTARPRPTCGRSVVRRPDSSDGRELDT